MLMAVVGLVEMDSTRHRCTRISRPAPQPTHRGLGGWPIEVNEAHYIEAS